MNPIQTDKINGVIYKTTNVVNGQWYIGKDENNNSSYLGSGVYLNRAISKYGRESFKKEILFECNSREELCISEIEFIKKYNAVNDPLSYNIATGGNGGNTIAGMTSIDKINFSEKMKEIYVTMPIDKKKSRSQKISKALSGKAKSKEHKDKISLSKTGVKQSLDTIDKKRKISKDLYDKGIISLPKNVWIGRKHKDETKLLLSSIKSGTKNTKTRLFNDEQQTIIYNLFLSGTSIKELSEKYNTSCPTIRRYIKEIL